MIQTPWPTHMQSCRRTFYCGPTAQRRPKNRPPVGLSGPGVQQASLNHDGPAGLAGHRNPGPLFRENARDVVNAKDYKTMYDLTHICKEVWVNRDPEAAATSAATVDWSHSKAHYKWHSSSPSRGKHYCPRTDLSLQLWVRSYRVLWWPQDSCGLSCWPIHWLISPISIRFDM